MCKKYQILNKDTHLKEADNTAEVTERIKDGHTAVCFNEVVPLAILSSMSACAACLRCDLFTGNF